MCVIWGIPYLLIRVAVRDLSPASVVFFRTAAATLLLLPIAVRRGALVDVFRRWRPLLLFTAIEVTCAVVVALDGGATPVQRADRVAHRSRAAVRRPAVAARRHR